MNEVRNAPNKFTKDVLNSPVKDDLAKQSIQPRKPQIPIPDGARRNALQRRLYQKV
jgi:hypothetical protein